MLFSSRYRVEFLALFCLGCVGETPFVTDCVLGTTDCGGRCVELSSSPDHCGACGLACEAGYRCEQARCLCAATLCDGQCVDLERSPSHCGTCETPCDVGLTCEAGACTARCEDGLVSCDGACVDARTDRNNCGSCREACPDGASCQDGSCTCSPGRAICGDRCVDLDTDPEHCGDCDQGCSDGETCRSASCILACGPAACAAGETAFTRALPSQNNPVVLDDVAILPGGDSVVAGTFRGELNLGSLSATALGTDIFVARFDRRGQLQWLRRYGAEGVEMAVGALTATDERIVVAGSVDGPVTIDTNEYAPQGVDALVLELTHDGLVEASEVFGGPGRQRLTAVAPFAGGLALGGSYSGDLERNGTPLGSNGGLNDRDAFVLLRDGTGATAWSSVAADPGNSAAQTVTALDVLHGSLGATVTSDGPASVGGESFGDANPSAALIAWDASGVRRWTLVATSDDQVSAPRLAATRMAVTHRGAWPSAVRAAPSTSTYRTGKTA